MSSLITEKKFNDSTWPCHRQNILDCFCVKNSLVRLGRNILTESLFLANWAPACMQAKLLPRSLLAKVHCKNVVQIKNLVWSCHKLLGRRKEIILMVYISYSKSQKKISKKQNIQMSCLPFQAIKSSLIVQNSFNLVKLYSSWLFI